MAHEIFNSKIDNGSFYAISAGLATFDGCPITDNAKEALEEIGINSNHSSKQITKDMLDAADYVIGMTSNHAKIIIESFPNIHNKVYSFPKDIVDPYGGNIDIYRACRDEISKGIDIIISKLINEK